jgi:tetratricopeptide (TPR) repeat protein
MQTRKLPEAEGILKKAVDANPKDPNFKTLLAAHYFANGNRPEGVKILDQMKGDIKSYPSAYFTAGDFYLRVNDTTNAVKQFQDGQQKDPAHKLDYQKRIIEVLVRQGKIADAYEKNAEVLKENPKDPEARGLKGTFLLDKGDVAQAINDLQATVTARPDNPVARFQLGRAHYAKGELEQARQQFEKAVQIRNDYLPPRLALAQIALARGDNDGALKLSQEALRIAPQSGAARLMLSAAEMRGGNFKDSRATLDTVLAANPKQPETLLELGVLNMMEKKYPEAAVQFRKAYESDPTNTRGLLGETESYMLMNKPDQAIQTVQAEVNRFPNRNDLKRDLADIQFRTGHFDVAIQAYQNLMPLYKDNPRQQGDLYARMGDGYIRKSDYPQAITQLRKAHDLVPDSTPIMNALALLLENTGNHVEARKIYEASISKNGENGEALNNLAFLMAETGGNLDEALTLATRAKQKLPNFPEISDTIGWIYLKKNLADSAVDIFKELTAKVPQNSTFHYHYAMALMQKGDKVSAAKECREALDKKPNKEEEQHIRELMAKI